MKNGNFEVSVLVHARKITEYNHKGETFVEGRTGQKYKVRVCNNSDQRILAVVSVDGLSVMDGQEARLSSGGYVLGPHQTMEILGWRLDNSEVAQFVFGNHDDSYAAKMGKPKNIGVIGCAIFEEKPRAFKMPDLHIEPRPRPTIPSFPPKRWPQPDRYPRVYGDSLDRDIVVGSSVERRLTASVQNLGTEFGPRQKHEVVDVEFEAQDKAAAVFQIVYDTREGLEARGVRLKEEVKVALNAFPGERGCPPPKGWQRS